MKINANFLKILIVSIGFIFVTEAQSEIYRHIELGAANSLDSGNKEKCIPESQHQVLVNTIDALRRARPDGKICLYINDLAEIDIRSAITYLEKYQQDHCLWGDIKFLPLKGDFLKKETYRIFEQEGMRIDSIHLKNPAYSVYRALVEDNSEWGLEFLASLSKSGLYLFAYESFFELRMLNRIENCSKINSEIQDANPNYRYMSPTGVGSRHSTTYVAFSITALQ